MKSPLAYSSLTHISNPSPEKKIPSEAELPCHIPQPARRGRQPPTPIRQSRTTSSANRVRFKTRDFHHCQRIVYCSAGRGSAEMHCCDSGHAEMMRRVHMNGRPGRSLCIRIKRASYLSTASKQSRARACADTTTPPRSLVATSAPSLPLNLIYRRLSIRLHKRALEKRPARGRRRSTAQHSTSNAHGAIKASPQT